VPCGHHEHPIPSGAPATQWNLPASRRHAIPVGSTAETNSKNIASRLVSPIPAWLRNYANVPSAINRPSAMMPIRLAIRSATSNIWVVMITCASPFTCPTKTSFTTRADTASCPVNSSSKKSALYFAPTRRPTRLSDALSWKNHASVRAHWSQGAAYRSVREFGGRGRQFPEPSDGFKILKRRDFFIKHRLLQHPGDQKFCRQRVLQRIDSKYLDGALVQPQQSGNHLQRRGFAHAIGSDQRLNSPGSTRSFKP
jgi:hypothetical protein